MVTPGALRGRWLISSLNDLRGAPQNRIKVMTHKRAWTTPKDITGEIPVKPKETPGTK